MRACVCVCVREYVSVCVCVCGKCIHCVQVMVFTHSLCGRVHVRLHVKGMTSRNPPVWGSGSRLAV